MIDPCYYRYLQTADLPKFLSYLICIDFNRKKISKLLNTHEYNMLKRKERVAPIKNCQRNLNKIRIIKNQSKAEAYHHKEYV